jgi:thioredoxin 1
MGMLRRELIVLWDSMPTVLVFKSGQVTETIRGANAGALRTAVSKAAADSGGASGSSAGGAAFGSKGYRLGNEGDKGGRTVAGSAGGLGEVADSMVRFMGLYLTTLFSFDAYAAAEASPLRVNRR